jgi:hypothetical protein
MCAIVLRRAACVRDVEGVGADREKVKRESVDGDPERRPQRNNAPNKSRSGLAAPDCRDAGAQKVGHMTGWTGPPGGAQGGLANGDWPGRCKCPASTRSTGFPHAST